MMADTTKLHTKHQMNLMTYAAELIKKEWLCGTVINNAS
jgi:hypothetical protein